MKSAVEQWDIIEPAPDIGAGATVSVAQQRLGVVLATDASEREAEGVLNPGIVRDRNGELLMYPRMVARGNVSCIGLARARTQGSHICFEREGIALEPEMQYELREGAHGCEDPRVTFIPSLDRYVMAYTAFGEAGPRVALAVSDNARVWRRLGLLRFSLEQLNARDNKDAAFFPEPVISPSGVRSFALYHRPMRPESVAGQTPIPVILGLDSRARETTCVGYVPAAGVEEDETNLCDVTETVDVLPVDRRWGWLKNGAGTPPIALDAGWLSFFHGVDVIERDGRSALYYSAGIVIHDIARPDVVLYRSAQPVLGPLTVDERFGIVDDVVFPTGIDPRGDSTFDVYYGAADAKIALVRFHVTVRR